jgi:manganese/zinc/iron transport system ATP- binding protein
MDEVAALSVDHLTVHYDKIPVLWEVNFAIPQGLLVAVLGPNGAGKSTLLNALLQLQKPTSGKVTFFGKPLSEVRKKVAYIPQRTSVDWTFPISVLDVVLMGRYGKLGLLKWPSKGDKRAALEVLEQVGMLPFAHRQINALSGGQKQRVFFARALLQEADLYFMDEPFAGIDITTEKALIHILSTLKQEGKTLIIVHHDLTTVRHYFDWAILLNSCLIDCGPVEKVFHEENLKKAYGSSAYLVAEAKNLYT